MRGQWAVLLGLCRHMFNIYNHQIETPTAARLDDMICNLFSSARAHLYSLTCASSNKLVYYSIKMWAMLAMNTN